MSTAIRSRNRALAFRTLGGAIVGLACIGAVVWSRGTGEIHHRGRVLRFPLPYASVQLASSEGRATYWVFGSPNLSEACATRGAGYGWKDYGQMGLSQSFVSTTNEKLLLSAGFELVTVYSMFVDFRVYED